MFATAWTCEILACFAKLEAIPSCHLAPTLQLQSKWRGRLHNIIHEPCRLLRVAIRFVALVGRLFASHANTQRTPPRGVAKPGIQGEQKV